MAVHQFNPRKSWVKITMVIYHVIFITLAQVVKHWLVLEICGQIYKFKVKAQFYIALWLGWS
jgi:hypothetical protein